MGCGGRRSPDLDALDDPVLGSGLRIRGRAFGGSLALLMMSVAPTLPSPPLAPSPCVLAVDPFTAVLVRSYALGTQGFADRFAMPSETVLIGFQIVLQFAAGPTDATLGFDLSNGLLLTLGR